MAWKKAHDQKIIKPEIAYDDHWLQRIFHVIGSIPAELMIANRLWLQSVAPSSPGNSKGFKELSVQEIEEAQCKLAMSGNRTWASFMMDFFSNEEGIKAFDGKPMSLPIQEFLSTYLSKQQSAGAIRDKHHIDVTDMKIRIDQDRGNKRQQIYMFSLIPPYAVKDASHVKMYGHSFVLIKWYPTSSSDLSDADVVPEPCYRIMSSYAYRYGPQHWLGLGDQSEWSAYTQIVMGNPEAIKANTLSDPISTTLNECEFRAPRLTFEQVGRLLDLVGEFVTHSHWSEETNNIYAKAFGTHLDMPIGAKLWSVHDCPAITTLHTHDWDSRTVHDRLAMFIALEQEARSEHNKVRKILDTQKLIDDQTNKLKRQKETRGVGQKKLEGALGMNKDELVNMMKTMMGNGETTDPSVKSPEYLKNFRSFLTLNGVDPDSDDNTPITPIYKNTPSVIDLNSCKTKKDIDKVMKALGAVNEKDLVANCIDDPVEKAKYAAHSAARSVEEAQRDIKNIEDAKKELKKVMTEMNMSKSQIEEKLSTISYGDSKIKDSIKQWQLRSSDPNNRTVLLVDDC